MNDNLSTVSQWLNQATKLLETSGIGTARLDALILLCDCLGKNRAHLLAHPDLKLTRDQQDELLKLLNRRSHHEPLAYIRGKTEFYGRSFSISKAVLEPRPESEMMIDLLLQKRNELREATIIDVGTGSGALAITAKLELPKTKVSAIDVDQKCLELAKENAARHSVSIEYITSDLLLHFPNHVSNSPSVILANLPYVPDDYQINSAALHEPRLAIFGGADGLELYRTMFNQLSEWQDAPLYVFTEALPFQHNALQNIASTQNFNMIAQEDFIQVFLR
jgi:release factor glutamine methyltransferase